MVIAMTYSRQRHLHPDVTGQNMQVISECGRHASELF